jgi:hypothetical protein
MTDPVRIQKNVLCDLLVKEGIDGRPDDDSIQRTCTLTALAIELGRTESLAHALAWHGALYQRAIKEEQAIVLDLSSANTIAGTRYGTDWKWDQPTLAQEIFHLRRAISNPQFRHVPDITKCKCLNNLGNRLKVAGRAVEALEYWRRALEVIPNFGMALCNRAITLANYGSALEDPHESVLFRWQAHKESSAAIAPTALYTDVSDRHTKNRTEKLKDWLESTIDVIGISALDPSSCSETCTEGDERNYRHWCLINGLFVNPLNDLGPYPLAAADTMGLPQHVVRVDAPHKFESFFFQMKQEYVSARRLLYEGTTSTTPHFSDRDVLLGATDQGWLRFLRQISVRDKWICLSG